MELRQLHQKNKKGMSIGDVYPTVLTIAIVAILLAVVMFVLSAWTETTATKVYVVTNETEFAIDETPGKVANASACGFNTFKVTKVMNATQKGWKNAYNLTIPATNYTYNEVTGTVTNATVITYSNTSISYTYQYGGADCEAVENVTEDFTDFVPWIGIILLVVAAAIVLSIVIRSFSGGNRV